MKCFFWFLVYLSFLISNVLSLGLTIQLDTLDGMKVVVVWTRRQSDPDPLGFDLRFVDPPSHTDVGLAEANIYPNAGENSGNLSIEFPKAGKYLLVAVSGPNNVSIGQSAVVEVPTSASRPMPSKEPTLSTSVPQTTPTVSATCEPRRINVPAIVGGIIGGISLLILLAAALFFIHRRRRTPCPRISFHQDMMVQQRQSDGPGPSTGPIRKHRRHGRYAVPYAFSSTGSSVSSTGPPVLPPLDVEQGLPVSSPTMAPAPGTPGVSKFLTRQIVPPPLGPRDRANKSFSAKQPVPITPRADDGQPTPRQQQLTDKLAQVVRQIEELKSMSKPGPLLIVRLDDLVLQKAWLEKQLRHMWASGDVDTLPPGHSRYMSDSSSGGGINIG